MAVNKRNTMASESSSSFLLLILLAIVAGTNCAIIHYNGEELYINSPVARYGRSYFNITDAPLAVANPIDLCNEQQADYTGKIVIATSVGCPPPTKIRNAQERGAIALLVHSEGRVGSSGNYYWRTHDGQRTPDTSLAFLTLNGSDGDLLRKLVSEAIANGTSITADVDPFDENPWIRVLDTSNQYTAACVILIVANAAGLGFALSRLISLVIAKGCERTTSHFTLVFICAGHASTVIYFTVNIIDIKTGPTAPGVVHNIFLIFPEMFQILASLMVSLYWFELINSVTNAPIQFIKKLVKPYIAIAIIISVLYLATIIIAGLNLSDFAIIVIYFIFVAISLMVAIIWMIIGGMLVKQIRTNEKIRASKRKKSNFNRLSTLIILCAICLALTRILYLWLGLDPNVGSNPDFWLIVTTLIFVFQLATSFIQTGLFKFHKRDFKTSRGSGTNSDDLDSKGSATSRKASTAAASLQMSAATKTTSTVDLIAKQKSSEESQSESEHGSSHEEGKPSSKSSSSSSSSKLKDKSAVHESKEEKSSESESASHEEASKSESSSNSEESEH